MAIDIPNGVAQGHWHRFGLMIWLRCPKCNFGASLADHQIASDGSVNPSVECPTGCGFHDSIRLLSWTH